MSNLSEQLQIAIDRCVSILTVSTKDSVLKDATEQQLVRLYALQDAIFGSVTKPINPYFKE
jgi:hypothetical protein